jgi:hypothetical protein
MRTAIVSLVAMVVMLPTGRAWSAGDPAVDGKDYLLPASEFRALLVVARTRRLPIEFAKHYPRADAGVGCVTNDIPLREKQENYARRYNEKVYDYVSKHPEVGKLKEK